MANKERISAFNVVAFVMAAVAIGLSVGLHTSKISDLQDALKRVRDFIQTTPVLEPAQPLEFLKNGLDKSKFKWVNSNEVKAGSQTCGFLTPTLGWEKDRGYPSVKVYICMRFADVQPASKGTIAVHCGGPGSLSDCGMVELLGESLKHYNVISIDQRGMGRSEPSFAQPECADRASPNGTFLKAWKERLSSCWAFPGFQLQATDGRRSYHFLEYSGTRQLVQDLWRFREVIGEKRLHVWGVSYGTQVMGLYATLFPDETGLFVVDSNVPPIPDMLAFATDTAENLQRRMNYMVSTCEAQNVVSPGACPVPDLGACIAQITRVDPDLGGAGKVRAELFDVAEKANNWNILGQVCEGAAELESTGKRAKYEQAKENLETFTSFIDYCEAFAKDGVCAIGGRCLNQVSILLQSEPQTSASMFSDWLNLLKATRSPAAEPVFRGIQVRMCEAAERSDKAGVLAAKDEFSALAGSGAGASAGRQAQTQAQGASLSPSAPSEANAVYGKPDYAGMMDGMTIQTLIFGQTMSGGCYDDAQFMRMGDEVRAKYPGYGDEPWNMFAAWYQTVFRAPKPNPIPPLGNPFQRGIVAGVLFDQATPYKWTLQMRAAFPSATLVSSQWITHGTHKVVNSDERHTCLDHTLKYFETGVVAAADGTICSSPIPEASQILQ